MKAFEQYTCYDEQGFPVLCDPFHAHVAFRCVGCGAPVLAVLFRDDQRGASAGNPSVCRACGCQYWVAQDHAGARLTLYRVRTW